MWAYLAIFAPISAYRGSECDWGTGLWALIETRVQDFGPTAAQRELGYKTFGPEGPFSVSCRREPDNRPYSAGGSVEGVFIIQRWGLSVGGMPALSWLWSL